MEGLNDVKQELETKREALAKELEAAKDQLSAVQADLKRVDDALSALNKSKKKSRSKSRSKKSSPTPQAPLPRSQSSQVEDPWSPAHADDHHGFDFGQGGHRG